MYCAELVLYYYYYYYYYYYNKMTVSWLYCTRLHLLLSIVLSIPGGGGLVFTPSLDCSDAPPWYAILEVFFVFCRALCVSGSSTTEV